MKYKFEFFIAGSFRNKENILKICNIFDNYHISYYCFLKNEDDYDYDDSSMASRFSGTSRFEELDNAGKQIPGKICYDIDYAWDFMQ